MNNKFIITVPIYNAVKWIDKCMISILEQDYKNFEIYAIDDGSTDGTTELLHKYDFGNGLPTGIAHIHYRDKNQSSACGSIAKAIEISNAQPDDILVTVDGDDWLAHNGVLTYLNNVYQDPNIWLTYGQFKPLSGTYSNYCKQLDNTEHYRKSMQWMTSHLRTYKKKLWDHLTTADLVDIDGSYYKFAGDLAIMFALVEMSGLKHSKFISDVLYVYNDLNEINEMKKNPAMQLASEMRIRNRSRHNQLASL